MIHNIKGLETVTLDDKNIGKVKGIDKKNRNYFIVFKKGLLMMKNFIYLLKLYFEKQKSIIKFF